MKATKEELTEVYEKVEDKVEDLAENVKSTISETEEDTLTLSKITKKNSFLNSLI